MHQILFRVSLALGFVAGCLAVSVRAQEAPKTPPTSASSPPAPSSKTAFNPVNYPLTGVFGYVIPLEWDTLKTGNTPMVLMRIDGSEPMWFTVDIGFSGHVLLEERIAERLKLEKMPGSAPAFDANSGKRTFGLVQIKKLEATSSSGGSVPIKMPWIFTSALQLEDETVWTRKLAGTVGAQTFGNLTLWLDYEKHFMVLIPGEHPSMETDTNGITLPLRSKPKERGDYVEWTPIAGGKPILALLDSGAAMSALPPAMIQSLKPKATAKTTLGTPYGVQQKTTINWIPSLKVGPYTLNNVQVLADKDQPAIGADILSRFRVFIDYRRRLITFEPNDRTESVQEIPGRSWITQGRENGVLVVSAVSNNAPALVRLQGKKVLTIDGTPTTEMTLHGAQLLLDGYAETQGRIRVDEKGSEEEVEFHRTNVYGVETLSTLLGP